MRTSQLDQLLPESLIKKITALPVSRQRKWQIKMRLLGYCMICGTKAFKAGLCQRHYLINQSSTWVRMQDPVKRAKNAAYQNRRNAKLRAAGICIRCGKVPAQPNLRQCKKCAMIMREYSRNRYAAMKAAFLQQEQ